MEQLLAQLCFLLSMNSQLSDPACKNSLKSAYIQSGGQSTYNLAQKYYQNKLYSEVNRNLLTDAFILGAIGDSINKKDFKVSTSCKPFCDTLSVDFNEKDQSYNLGFKWSF